MNFSGGCTAIGPTKWLAGIRHGQRSSSDTASGSTTSDIFSQFDFFTSIFLASVLVDARDQVCLIRSRQNPVPFQIRFYENYLDFESGDLRLRPATEFW